MPEQFKAFTQTLFNTDQPATRYILNATGRILVIVIPASIVLGILFPNVEAPDYTGLTSSIPSMFFLLVIAAPLLETLIMWPVIALIRLFTKITWQVALVSGLFWGFLHWQQSPLQGVVTTWSFFVMSVCFIVWRKHSLGQSYFYTAGIHALNNLVAFLLMTPLLFMDVPPNEVSSGSGNQENFNIQIIGGEEGIRSTVTGTGANAVISTNQFTLRTTDGVLTIDGQRLDVTDRNIVIDTSDPDNILINGQPFRELITE